MDNETRGGIGFLGALQILFIALKLMDFIDWTWFWVLAPTILPLIFMLAVLLVVFLGSIIVAIINGGDDE